MKKSLTTYAIVVLTGIVTLASSILTNLLTPIFEKQKFAMPLLITLAFAGLALLVIKWRQGLEVDIDVDPIRDDTAAQQHAQRGLIVFLSLYRPLAGSAKALTAEQIHLAAANLDYQALDLANTANTTLGHQIKAIKSHLSKLEHCWIVCTRATEEGKTQSLNYAPVFVEYINREVAPALQMHAGKDYSIELDDDAIVCRDAYRLIKRIYQEAKAHGLKKTDLITDITGGFRAMTIGAILACLDKDVDIQYIGTTYNGEGNPTPAAFPMVVQYQPEFAESG